MNKSASFTVEAAFVLPLVFYTVLFLLSYCFFCHDRGRLQAVGEEVAKKAVAYVTYSIDLNQELDETKYTSQGILYLDTIEKEKRNLILQYAKERLEQGYFVSGVSNLCIETTRAQIKIKGTLAAIFPGAKLFGILHKDSVTIPFCFEENRWKREEKARIIEVATTLGQKIEGVEKAIEKIKELINQLD